MTKMIRHGLALGSGGARGLAHAGVLSVLHEEGLAPHIVAGTSMGAIVGGIYAETADPRTTWRRLAAFVQDPEFLDTWAPFIAKGSGEDGPQGPIQSLVSSLNRRFMQIRTVTRPALVDADKLRRPLEKLFTARDFREFVIPFAAVGIDLIGGERVVFREGSVIEAVYGSAAIPGVFPPLVKDGMLIVDGGAPFRVPLNTCREMGADIVIAVDIPGFESSKHEYRTGLDIMFRCDALARERLDAFVMANADVVIRPDVSDYHWADFRCSDDCRLRGEEAARRAVPEIRAAIAGAYEQQWGWRSRLRRVFGGA